MWLFLGIGSGLFHALMSAVSKKVLENTNQYILAFVYAAFSIPFVLIAIFWQNLVPVNPTFWWATIGTSCLNVLALILYMKALKTGELSLTVPFLSFTPVFLIFTSALMLDEMPNHLGIVGIILIVIGTYVLETKTGTGIWGPFKAFLKNKGGQLTLMVALIYAVSSNLDKMAIQASNPTTRILAVQAMMALLLFIIIRFRSKQRLTELKPKLKFFWLIGFLTAASLFCQMIAFQMALVPYIVSLKRTSALFSVILGVIAFKEKNIKPRLLGTILMIIGVLFISVS